LQSSTDSRRLARGDLAVLILLALLVAALHMLTNGRYGFHRDELQVLDDARHLALGYVAYPPFTPFVERVSLALFGTSLVGLRFFSVLAQAVVVILSGLMARELGGRRLAQIVSAVAVTIGPFALFNGSEFQYGSFDYLWWVLAAYLVVRLLRSGDPRWWLVIGVAIGLGMMTKYTMAFFVAGIVGGALLTPVRRNLRSPWIWCGAALAFLVFLPNLIWQIDHHFVSLDFLRHIHVRDVGEGRADHFLRDQFLISTNLLAAPLWLAGLVYVFASPEGKRFRMIGWMYAIPLAVFAISKGRGYYLAPAYPMLFPAGAVWGERWVHSLALGWKRLVLTVEFVLLAAGAAASAAVILPLFPIGSPHNIALRINGDLREEIGWPELVATVAHIRDSPPADKRNGVGILAGNYGEAGAIDLYGPAHGLPAAISGVNSFWQRGYGDPPPGTLIVIGFSREFVEANFQSCAYAGHNANPYGLKNEESEYHPDIFVCGAPRKPWPEFWSHFQLYG